jgi:uncharacterized protein (TIGR03067 family)
MHAFASARLVFAGLLCIAWSGFASADGPQDSKDLQGTWTAVKMELAGQALPWMVTLTITGDNYEIVANGRPDKGTCKVDTSTRPGRMTITGSEGSPNAGKTFLAIYELDGDKLRICYDLSGQKHPEAFATEKGTPLYLVMYQRKK